MPIDALRPLRLTSVDDPALRPWHLSVDGMSPQGPNLSHWPGNRTPQPFKADLSTGICLRFARAAAAERERFLAGADQVLNDHYDTDGFLSLLAVLRPELALAHEEVCLAAAATGDFQAFVTERAFAIDRTVLHLGSDAGPLAGELAGLSVAARNHRRYAWLIDNAEAVLTEPRRFAPLWQDACRGVRAALDRAHAGGLRREVLHGCGLSVLTGEEDFPRIVLNTVAGAYRVAHFRPTAGGALLRYHDRTESWFEMVDTVAPRRIDLRPLAQDLQELEPGGRDGCWYADPPDEPIPELYHGLPAAQGYGEVSRTLTPSGLPAEHVIAMLAAALAPTPYTGPR